MVQTFLFILSFIIFGFSFLIPLDATIWMRFIGEYLVFVATLFLLISISFNKIKLPKIIISLFVCACIPLIQFAWGQIYLWTTAIVSFFYLIVFCFVVTGAYSSESINKSKLMTFLCITFVVSGCVSTVMACSQWLNFYIQYLPTLELSGSRPFANFGQPNHLSTFLFMALVSVWYLYETNRLKSYFSYLIGLFLIFGIALTQSRTAWVVCLFIAFFYFLIKTRAQLKLNTLGFGSLFASYIVFISILPPLTKILEQLFQLDLTQTRDIVSRASSGHERLSLWQQSLDLILLQPWQGYGWNQVGVSIVENIDKFYWGLWYTSSHNIVLDIFLWVGIPLGILILAYICWLLYILLINAKSKEAYLSLMMMLPIIVHSFLEYPLSYSYFLFPLGLLLGIALADIKYLKFFELNKIFNSILLLIYATCLAVVWQEYVNSLADQSKAKILALERMVKKEAGFLKIENHYYLLTSLEYHAIWVALDVKNKYSVDELNKFESFVKSNPSKYNLLKLTQIYLGNGYYAKANLYLHIFNILYKRNDKIEDVMKNIN
ncbi:O-antigen ligase family protein [Acinetobacter pragensis]|uniref:Polymerase n=1 Tax=Acinetobacter pragensis TaxID=1806892 RepID=A0A151XYJ5_9GAMM|nr:O-antigen ligase family protein [Acinetobacter pragensis]KYQ70882.1 hypothetical protein AZH43_17020 [Acinetobacter pragensis]